MVFVAFCDFFRPELIIFFKISILQGVVLKSDSSAIGFEKIEEQSFFIFLSRCLRFCWKTGTSWSNLILTVDWQHFSHYKFLPLFNLEK